MGQLAEGRRWLTAALDRPSPASALIQARALTTDGALAVLEGNFVTCFERSRAAVLLARESGDQLAEARARWIHFCGWLYTDRIEAGVPELEQALVLFEQATSTTDRAWGAYALSHRAGIAAWLGEQQQGIALYEEALARAAGSDCVTLIILSDVIGWLIELGETARARGMLHEALAIGAGHRERWLVGGPLLSLALIDAAEGRAAPAARRLGAIAAVMTLAGMDIPTHFQVRIERAAMLAKDEIGGDAYATAWAAGRADPGAVIAEALGRSDVTLATLDDDVAAPYGLTRRQRDVLRLLADGRTDKEIAGTLFVTRRTASKHVAAILSKLGVDSRTAAVALALRRGLLEPST